MTPLRTIKATIARTGMRNPSSSRNEWKTAMVTICHISSVFANSVFVMPRTATVTLPYIIALASANSAPT